MPNGKNKKNELKNSQNFNRKKNKEIPNPRKIILSALENLELSNTALKQRTTELQLSEQNILQKKALNDAILSSIGDGLAVMDKEGKITYVNQAFEKMVGWKSKEVLGKYAVEVIPRESEKGELVLFNERILTKVLSGEVVIADLINPFYYIRKNKTRFPVSSIVNPIILEGHIIGVVETFRDITK